MAMVQGPETKTFRIAASESGTRIDKYVAETCAQFSRSYIQKLIEQSYILINGHRAKANQRLHIGDEISINLPLPSSISLVAEPIPLTIVYEDVDLLVIDKPAGLTVHPAPGHPNHTLVNALLSHCPSLAKMGDSIRPGIVHRLDKDTSGLMIVAKNSSAQQYLINQFKSHKVLKSYLVLVSGKLALEQGVIEAPIGRDPANRKRMAVVAEGREASTHYVAREYLGNYTLLEVNPRTGRTHQIRVHLSAIGYPVAGDPLYGVKLTFLKRQFVHAHRLGFCLPPSGEYREFTCELAADLQQALRFISESPSESRRF